MKRTVWCSKYWTWATAGGQLWLPICSPHYIPVHSRSHQMFNSIAKGLLLWARAPYSLNILHRWAMQHSPAAGNLFLKVTASVLGERIGMGGGSPWGGTADVGDCDRGSGLEHRLEAELASPAPSRTSKCATGTWSILPPLCKLQSGHCNDQSLTTFILQFTWICHAGSNLHSHNLAISMSLPYMLI
jgi:hypothetical protein